MVILQNVSKEMTKKKFKLKYSSFRCFNIYAPQVVSTHPSRTADNFGDIATMKASCGVLAGAWRSGTSVNVICISNCKHVVPRYKNHICRNFKAYSLKLTCAPSLLWEVSTIARIAIEWMRACQYAVGELTTLFQLLSYLIIQGGNKNLGCQPP